MNKSQDAGKCVFDISWVIEKLLKPVGNERRPEDILTEIEGRLIPQTPGHFGALISFIIEDIGLARMPMGLTQVLLDARTTLREDIRKMMITTFLNLVYSRFTFTSHSDPNGSYICGKMLPGVQIRTDSLHLWLALIARPFTEVGGRICIGQKPRSEVTIPDNLIQGVGLILPMIPAHMSEFPFSVQGLARKMQGQDLKVIPSCSMPFVAETVMFALK
jgi:hypothetical protein